MNMLPRAPDEGSRHPALGPGGPATPRGDCLHGEIERSARGL